MRHPCTLLPSEDRTRNRVRSPRPQPDVVASGPRVMLKADHPEPTAFFTAVDAQALTGGSASHTVDLLEKLTPGILACVAAFVLFHQSNNFLFRLLFNTLYTVAFALGVLL